MKIMKTKMKMMRPLEEQKKTEEVEEDPIEEARRLAEKKFADAKAVIAAQEKCSLQ